MKDSDRKSFLELYEPVHPKLSKFCRVISGNVEDAEDLLNDTVLNAMENFGKLRKVDAFKAYVFSIASNINKKRIRRKKFRAEFNEKELNCLIDLSQNPEYITDFRIIYDQLLKLPDKMAEAMILFHISDLSLEEIRKIQGGSLSGVKLRLKRGREKLISILHTPRQVSMIMMFFTF